MADTKGKVGATSTVCNDSCGCPSPCPGGQSCRCTGTETHMKCSCGDHCGCNPCRCTKTTDQVQGTGKAFCKCGSHCNCATCAA